MNFSTWLESQATQITEEQRKRIFTQATTDGIEVHRGIKPQRSGMPYASDPGDFGRGIYYSTNWHRARSYATSDKEVQKSVIKFKSPLVLSDTDAYKISERFHTVVLSDEELRAIKGYKERAQKLLDNAKEMTDHMIGLGCDGLIAVDRDGNMEIVDYRPYLTAS